VADRTIYDLSPDGEGWALRKRGGKQASRRFDTKAEGVEKSPGIVKGKGKSQLVIRKKDGTIQEERTYGDDPERRVG
jgi:hypothetical protein